MLRRRLAVCLDLIGALLLTAYLDHPQGAGDGIRFAAPSLTDTRRAIAVLRQEHSIATQAASRFARVATATPHLRRLSDLPRASSPVYAFSGCLAWRGTSACRPSPMQRWARRPTHRGDPERSSVRREDEHEALVRAVATSLLRQAEQAPAAGDGALSRLVRSSHEIGEDPGGTGNTRNGRTRKTLMTGAQSRRAWASGQAGTTQWWSLERRSTSARVRSIIAAGRRGRRARGDCPRAPPGSRAWRRRL